MKVCTYCITFTTKAEVQFHKDGRILRTLRKTDILETKVSYSFAITYLLTPCSRVLLEKLTDSAASQEIPRIFGTQRFITVFTSARHMSLS
jgi:hypothetical protein